MNGKDSQIMHWESDRFIVVMKQVNACVAKGSTGRLLEGDTTDRLLRAGNQLSTKSNPVTYLLVDREVFLESRVRKICKYGSVRRFIVNSKRRWL